MPKTVPNGQGILKTQFAIALGELTNIEKQAVKLYGKLKQATFTAELAKALTPEISDQPQHLTRLKLIHTSLKLGKINASTTTDLAKLKLSAKKSAEQDLAIISHALKWQNLKLAYYEFLYPLAKSLDLETEATLLEQTITDNRNTNTWLRQIIQNIIAPSLQD